MEDENIFVENDIADKVFIILSGSVKISAKKTTQIRKKEEFERVFFKRSSKVEIIENYSTTPSQLSISTARIRGKELQIGDIFGEQSLIDNDIRNQKATALKKTSCAVFSKNIFMKCRKKFDEDLNSKKILLEQTIPMFDKYSDSINISEAILLLKRKSYTKNSCITVQNIEITNPKIYLLEKGTIRMEKELEKETIALSIIDTPCLFGEESLQALISKYNNTITVFSQINLGHKFRSYNTLL